MSGEAWGALIGLLTYFGMKAIDRIFTAVDEVMRRHGIDGKDDEKEEGKDES